MSRKRKGRNNPPPAPARQGTSSQSSSTSTSRTSTRRAFLNIRRAIGLTGAVAGGSSTGLSLYQRAVQKPTIVDKSKPVSVGEYCTLTRAKELGIFNETKYRGSSTNAPFGADYNDLKMYNDAVDTKDNRAKTLCKTVIQGSDPETATTEAYPHCIDLKGPGFIKRANTSPDSPYQCQVYDCPPGFSPTGEFCSKEPMYKDALIDKRSRCDERWYDWFMIPNYHLGNKYHEEAVGKCFVPCPNNYVPYYVIDPVDETRMGFFGENKMTQCVPKGEYFGGKYAQTSDYCPLAWIYRLYTCNKDNAKQLIQQKQELLRKNNPDQTTTIFANASSEDNVNKEAMYIAKHSQKFVENVKFPKEPMLQACNTLNTKERLDTAYNICERLNKEGLLNLTGGDDANNIVNANRNEVLKQACNAVFCNEQVGSLDVIGKDPICFESAKKIDPSSAVTMSDEKPSQPDYSDNEKFLYRSFVVTLFIIMFLVGGMICYLLFTRMIWPYTRWFFYKLFGLWTGRRYLYVEYRAKAMDEIARARSRAAASMSQ